MKGITMFHPLEDIVEVFSRERISLTIKTNSQNRRRNPSYAGSCQAGLQPYNCLRGDGTINEVVNGIVDTNVVMGIIPLGTENILAKSMDVPLDIKQACRHFLKRQNKSGM
jgi:hypothetical protein